MIENAEVCHFEIHQEKSHQLVVIPSIFSLLHIMTKFKVSSLEYLNFFSYQSYTDMIWLNVQWKREDLVFFIWMCKILTQMQILRKFCSKKIKLQIHMVEYTSFGIFNRMHEKKTRSCSTQDGQLGNPKGFRNFSDALVSCMIKVNQKWTK